MAQSIGQRWRALVNKEWGSFVILILFFALGFSAGLFFVQPVAPSFGWEKSVSYPLPPNLPLKQLVLNGDRNRLEARNLTEFINNVPGAYGVVGFRYDAKQDKKIFLDLYSESNPLSFSLLLGDPPPLSPGEGFWNRVDIAQERVAVGKETITVPFVYSPVSGLTKPVLALMMGIVSAALLGFILILPFRRPSD
jgi:hypothetical protein